MIPKTKYDQLEGCFLGGAIGDAMGSQYENQIKKESDTYHPFGEPKVVIPKLQITDDTQLTFATIEAITENYRLSPQVLAEKFKNLYKTRTIRGLGSSTLKALQELEAGGHWSQVGRMGEYAAGNGAAMRIAPLAFIDETDRTQIRDISSISHRNDEAYVGALSVVIGIKQILNNQWDGSTNLLSIISAQIPDSRVKDRMLQLEPLTDLAEIGSYGNSGYVVDSIPLALAAANQIANTDLDTMFERLIEVGGDTDTNCSIAGQIAGCFVGKSNFSSNLLEKIKTIPEYEKLDSTLNKFGAKLKWL
ncbi:MAG: ADP-ribosylglycohydrolase family protein [Flavobacteriales bacterium]|nr:ADP-ribosylglycohydrolase family protein [Flavobacteriales bacterium]